VLTKVLSGKSGKQLVGSAGVGFTTAITQSAAAAWTAAANSELAEDQRAAALGFAGAAGVGFSAERPVQEFLHPSISPLVQQAAIRLLLQSGAAAATTDVLARLRSLTPAAQAELLDGLLQREDGTELLLECAWRPEPQVPRTSMPLAVTASCTTAISSSLHEPAACCSRLV
jgi:hypothetical protein